MTLVCSQPIMKAVATLGPGPIQSLTHAQPHGSNNAALEEKLYAEKRWILMVKCCGSCKLCGSMWKIFDSWNIRRNMNSHLIVSAILLEPDKKMDAERKNTDFVYEFK